MTLARRGADIHLKRRQDSRNLRHGKIQNDRFPHPSGQPARLLESIKQRFQFTGGMTFIGGTTVVKLLVKVLEPSGGFAPRQSKGLLGVCRRAFRGLPV